MRETIKRYLAGLLAFLTLLALTGCGTQSGEEGNGDTLEFEYSQEEYGQLYAEYLESAVYSWVTASSWSSARELRPEVFTAFYYHRVLAPENPEGWEDALSVEQETLEAAVQEYFEVEPEHIREAPEYDAAAESYVFEYGTGSSEAVITKAVQDGELLLISFAYPSRADETVFIRSGTITIQTEGGHFKYIGCESNELPSE